MKTEGNWFAELGGRKQAAGILLSCGFAICWVGLACCASTADLKIDLQAPPWDQPQPLWRRLTYTIIVSNAGPDTATRVVVTNQVLEQFSDPVITVSQGGYTLTNRNLRCELGELASGNTASVTIEVTPTNVAALFLEAGVTSFNFDPTWPNTIYTQTAWVFSCSSFPALTLSDS